MQNTMVRTLIPGMPKVKWCEDCEVAVADVVRAGHTGQNLKYLATQHRADRAVCRLHAAMHDEAAAEIAAAEAEAAFTDDLLALVSATVWSGADEQVAAAIAEIDEIWAVA